MKSSVGNLKKKTTTKSNFVVVFCKTINMIKSTFYIFILVLSTFVFVNGQNYPFPNCSTYYTHIKPDNYNQEQLNDHVTSFYDEWKNKS